MGFSDARAAKDWFSTHLTLSRIKKEFSGGFVIVKNGKDKSPASENLERGKNEFEELHLFA